jgi:hypothetical protein
VATSPLDAVACLALAQRQVGEVADWTAQQWADQLDEDSVLRGDPPQIHYRPYRTALSYLLRPDRVSARGEGTVTEKYIDPAATAAHLRDLDAEWTALRLPPETSDGSGDSWDGTIRWGGY